MNSLEYLKSLIPIRGYQQESLPIAASLALLKRCDWAEFGVGNGFSTQRIYERLPEKANLHLFDWFKGLPEDWTRLNGNVIRKGKFACEPPNWIFDKSNIKVHKGLFEDTIPTFVELQKKKLGFINIDCDLYSSTKTVLENINHLIIAGTIIHFDEFWNYGSWEQHEFKAFIEYCTNWDRDFKYMARTNNCQVIVKIVR